MEEVVSYSQNREDLFIASFFPDISKGFYVDVGAYHPTLQSVTKFFYEKGWSGINIEPQKEYIKLLNKDRKRDVNLNVGVASKRGKLELREYAGGGLSTFSKNMKQSYDDDTFMRGIGFQDYEVDIVTLADIFKEHVREGQDINFLKVDVEGLEYEVLQGNDWSKYRPQLICIESNHIVKDWRPLLKEKGYIKVFFDGLNDYYLEKGAIKREKMFDFPAMFLAGKNIVPYELKRKIDTLEDRQRDYDWLKDELAKNVAEVQNLSSRISVLQDKYDKQMILDQSIKHHIKMLASLAKRRIESKVKRIRGLNE
jgi:FkbM family methyltransferase